MFTPHFGWIHRRTTGPNPSLSPISVLQRFSHHHFRAILPSQPWAALSDYDLKAWPDRLGSPRWDPRIFHGFETYPPIFCGLNIIGFAVLYTSITFNSWLFWPIFSQSHHWSCDQHSIQFMASLRVLDTLHGYVNRQLFSLKHYIIITIIDIPTI